MKISMHKTNWKKLHIMTKKKRQHKKTWIPECLLLWMSSLSLVLHMKDDMTSLPTDDTQQGQRQERYLAMDNYLGGRWQWKILHSGTTCGSTLQKEQETRIKIFQKLSFCIPLNVVLYFNNLAKSFLSTFLKVLSYWYIDIMLTISLTMK